VEEYVSSWHEDNEIHYSNCTRMFAWFSTQNNAWSSEVGNAADEKFYVFNEISDMLILVLTIYCKQNRYFLMIR
jgi:hypothetical protein